MIDDDEKDSKPVKRGAHALEEFLNITPLEVEKLQYKGKPLKRHEDYDPKDQELEEQIEEIFKKAMSGYINLEAILDGVEPKYRARLAEVALAYLNTSLNAVNSKAKQKETKDKILAKVQSASKGAKSTTNYVFTGDRNEAVRIAKRLQQQETPIEGEVLNTDDDDRE